MVSTDFIPMRVFQQNDWSVSMLDEKVYLITDANGSQCRTNSVRMLNCDEIMIGHPLVSDVRVNTRNFKSLPAHCLGDLLCSDRIDELRESFEEPVAATYVHKVHFKFNPGGKDIFHGGGENR